MGFLEIGQPPICPICLEPIGRGAMDSHLLWHAENEQRAPLGTIGGGTVVHGPALQDDQRAHELEAEVRKLADKIRGEEIAEAENRGVDAERSRLLGIAEEMARQYDDCWSPDDKVPDWQIGVGKSLREFIRRAKEGS